MEPMFNNDDVENLFHIQSPAFLQELISWNPEGNFDRISAMGMLMIILEDRVKIHIDLEKPVVTHADNLNTFLNKRINNNGISNKNFSFPKTSF